MGRKPQLIDQWGNPVQRSLLTEEVGAPTISGVRSPIAGYPADGLNPVRLAAILKEADQGDPVRFLELAETIEERDPHYLAVLGTRRRSVSQIDIRVEAASEAAEDTMRADMVREWLKRDELQSEIFDILDCLGKGFSATHIKWFWDGRHYWPERLERRDPRHFRFLRRDLTTPLMLDEHGKEEPLPAFKFIWATIPAKSGLPLRSGLARVASWGWMFKAFTQRDWAIFTQTYGQPLRVGKYGPGASEKDRNTLFRAVANIAGDCAAIIPEGMMIDFIETGNLSASSDLYKDRADWLDKQISKAVLGQTATTDAEVGGLGSGKEHREVQEDIERSDCKALSAILNRQLIQPWMQINFGRLDRYPRLVIERPEPEDITALTNAVAQLVPLGFRVSAKQMYDKLGLKEPTKGEDVLEKAAPPPVLPPAVPPVPGQPGPSPKVGAGDRRARLALQAAGEDDADPVQLMTDRLMTDAAPAIEGMLAAVEAMVAAAGSLEELREMMLAGFPNVPAGQLTNLLATALLAADLGGRALLQDQSDG